VIVLDARARRFAQHSFLDRHRIEHVLHGDSETAITAAEHECRVNGSRAHVEQMLQVVRGNCFATTTTADGEISKTYTANDAKKPESGAKKDFSFAELEKASMLGFEVTGVKIELETEFSGEEVVVDGLRPGAPSKRTRRGDGEE
jgi:hypothetical protein